MIKEINAALLIVTFIPMIGTAMFVWLAFHRMGYGKVGKYLCWGFSILVSSLVFGLINNTLGPSPEAQFVAGVLRVIGWTGLMLGFIYLYVEADRSIP
jgi:hypothetical protein